MVPNLASRAFRRFSLSSHFKGKSRIESLVEPMVPLPSLDVPIDFPDGFRMFLDRRCASERSFYFRNGEVETFAFIRAFLRPGMVFYDCGANVGLYSLLGATRVGPSGTVCAFEPTPKSFDRLNEHRNLNRFSWMRPFEVALGAENGTGTIHGFGSSDHAMNTLAGDDESTVVGSCTIRTLSDLAREESLPPPGLMKIDVEGGERDLLEGARSILSAERAPVMIIELSRRTMRRFGYDPEDLVKYIASIAGYRVQWRFLDRVLDVAPGDRLPHYDVLGADHGSNYFFLPETR